MIESILKAKSLEAVQSKEQVYTDFENWTKENRDQKMALMRQVGIEAADVALDYLKDMLNDEVDGKSLVWHYLNMANIESEIQFLQAIRDEYDIVDDELVETLSVDPEWITQGIRDRYKLLGELRVSLGESLDQSLLPEAEEL